MKTLRRLVPMALLLSHFVQAEQFSFGIIGDAGRENLNSRTVRESLGRSKTRLLILPGDNNYLSKKDSYAEVWSPWIKLGFLLDVAAIGNHNQGYEAERKFFGMPAEFYAKAYGETVRFLVLNSDNVKTATEQAAWLDSQLTGAREPFVFSVFHHPSYSVSRFHSSGERAAFQEAVRPVLHKHRSRLTALLVGHDHLATLLHFDDLPVIVSGAVTETRRDAPVNHVEDGVRVKTDWYYDTTPHWTRLDVDSEKEEAAVAFVKAKKDHDECNLRIKPGERAKLEANCVDGQLRAAGR